MNDEQLDRSLRSIGKACFVNYFEEFSNMQIPNSDLIDLLMQKEGYTESGSKTRVSQSRRIIREGRAGDALEIVADSNRVPGSVTQKAQELAREF